MRKRHEQKIAIISIVLLLGFNIPLLSIFDSAASVGGIPVFYLYIFSLWFLSIVVTFIIVKRYDE